MTSIKIITIDNSYSSNVIDLILTIQQKEFGLAISLKDQTDLTDIENFYKSAGGEFWGAFVGGRLVGTIALIKIGNNSGVIRKMFVEKDYRGKDWGIAQLLLNTLISYCKENEIYKLYLGTKSILEAAIRFYQRNNFTSINKTELPEDFPLMEIDDAFYKLKIEEAF